MKKNIFTSIIIASTAVFLPVLALADPVGLKVRLDCPITQGTANVVTHFGDYIAGFGVEEIQGQSYPVYFKSSAILNGHIPADLTHYRNQDVQYDSQSGKITCSYISSIHNEAAFSISYTMTNGKGGVVLNADPRSMWLTLPVGWF